jgi:hypothetical protein
MGGVEVQLHAFLISVLDRSELSDLRPGRITRTRSERAHCKLWIGDRVAPRAGLDDVEKRKISYPLLEWNYDSSVVLPITYSL